MDLLALAKLLDTLGLPHILSFVFGLLLCGTIQISASRYKKGNRTRNRSYGIIEMDNLPDEHFKRMFRLSRHAFNVLMERLEDQPDNTVDELQGVSVLSVLSDC